MKKYIYILLIVGALVLGNACFNGFVWDDEELILTNQTIKSLSNFPSLFGGGNFNAGGAANLTGLYYRPMMAIAFSLIYSVFGANGFFFHFFQIALHITNTILLFLILRYLFKAFLIKEFYAFLAALIFLIHPINIEAVVYLAAYQEVLYFFFASLAWYFLIKRKFSILFTSILLLLSFLSKETGFVFAFIIGVYILFFDKKNLKKYMMAIGISFLIYAFLRFGVAQIYFNKHGLTPMSVASLPERLINIPKIIYFYITTFFWPVNLTINQQWMITKISIYNFWWPLFVVINFFTGLFGIGVYFYKKNIKLIPLYLFFSIWFLAGLGLHLQIFPLDLTVAERWFYLPIVGLLGVLVLLVQLVKFEKVKIFFLIIIFLFGLRSFLRTFDWRDGYTLYSHDIKNSPESYDLQNNLGVELFRKGEFDEAKKHFILSSQLAPNWWTNWNNLGAIVEREGDYNLAKTYYQKAIDNGHYYLAYENMAKILTFRINREEGIKFTREALKYFPNNVTLLRLLGSN